MYVRRIIRVNKRQFSFGGKDFCAFLRPQNSSWILNYELFVYWQNLFEVYRTKHCFTWKWPWDRGISGQWLDIVGYQDIRLGFWLANCEFGYGKVNYYSTDCNTIQIWSWCSRYLSSLGNRYPAIYVASYVGRKRVVKKWRYSGRFRRIIVKYQVTLLRFCG